MRRPQPKKLDALILLARAAGGRRKRQSIIAGLVLLAVFLLLGGLLAGLLWPEPSPGKLGLTLFDRLTIPDGPVSLIAQVESENEGSRLSGREVHFEVPTTGLHLQAVTDRAGVAAASTSFPAGEQVIDVQAGYPGNVRKHERGAQGRGRVFVWPPETDILVVDADHSLTDIEPTAFRAMNNSDIPPLKEARDALRALKPRFHVVYWSQLATRPAHYTQLRAWLEGSWNPAQQLPDGPLLNESPGEGAGPDLGKGYRRVVAVSRAPDACDRFRSLGFETYLVGDAAAPVQEVHKVADWPGLVERLSR